MYTQKIMKQEGKNYKTKNFCLLTRIWILFFYKNYGKITFANIYLNVDVKSLRNENLIIELVTLKEKKWSLW